jgi:hypothetical protein
LISGFVFRSVMVGGECRGFSFSSWPLLSSFFFFARGHDRWTSLAMGQL